MRKLIGYIAFFLIFFLPSLAQARSYEYDSINIDYTVNRDSTVDVEEHQVFRYNGIYNKGWRSISLKGTSAVTDIKVIDGETGKELSRSFFDLDKTDSDSWGKYFITSAENGTDVSWYYNLGNTTHEWIIKYRLHGAVSFLSDRDELYWNAIGDKYDVPIRSSIVTVHIPTGASISNLSSSIYYDTYSKDQLSFKKITDPQTFEFSATNIPPNTFVTIAAGWPKGLVSISEYWKDFIKVHWQWPASVLFVIIFIIGLRAVKKRMELARGVIVPEYEPPENLRPAMAGIVVSGLTARAIWPATIIDLAVRGYLSIEEKTKKLSGFIQAFVAAGMTLVVILIGISIAGDFYRRSLVEIVPTIFGSIFVFAAILFAAIILIRNSNVSFGEYIIRRKRESEEGLEDYEKNFLATIFADSDTFSTKIGMNERERLSKEISDMSRELYMETSKDTGAFERVPVGVPMVSRFAWGQAIVLVLATFSLFGFIRFAFISFYGPFWITFGICAFIAIFYFVFSRRLSPKGKILREEWLGFKMYLETAEKYRLQNLTPDLFEKYLPYAMIFGIEKKWAKAFEGITVASPSWYSNSSAVATTGTSISFSPSGFSSNFSSSFASVFSSATGTSSGSGGGGSSGGGGGGGGGGAS